MIQNKTFTSNALIGDLPSVLNSIHKLSCNIVIFERNITPLKHCIEYFLMENKTISVKGTFEKISKTVNSYFGENSELNKDLINLLKHFQAVTKINEMSFLLTKIDSDMCRKFHTDMNDLRLLCTYKGKGTLWLNEDNIKRDLLYSNDTKNQGIINDQLINQVKTGAVAIFKGALYPKEGTQAAIHKSPSLEANNEQRLLLRIDTNEFLPNLVN